MPFPSHAGDGIFIWFERVSTVPEPSVDRKGRPYIDRDGVGDHVPTRPHFDAAISSMDQANAA